MPSTFMPCKINRQAALVLTYSSCLAVYVDNANINDILEAFPDGRQEGYYDPEKGYYDDEVGFRCVETGEVFNVYARWGQVRIGALNPTTPRALELAAWLTAAR